MGERRKRAAVYGRQSHGKEASVEDQLREGHADCAHLDAEVVKVYRDKVSASRFGTKVREDWPQLVTDVAAGELDLVWLWDASRGDRDPESWFPFLGQCRDRGVLIHSRRDRRTYDVRIPRDWKTLAEDGVNNAYDSEIKSVDTRRGIAGAVLEGKPPGGPAPHGLTRIYDPHDRRKFTQEPNGDAGVVIEIIERIAAKDPIIEIERDLNGRGVPPPGWRGIPTPLGWWRRNTIRNMARNPAYLGLRGHNGVHHEGNWPAISDDPNWADTWRAARAELGDPTRKTTAPGSYRWLLSYLAAAHCGALLQARRGVGSRADRYGCHPDGCTTIGVRELDEYVTRLVTAWFARKGARALFERADQQASAARVELRKLNDELEEWRASADQPGGVSAIALARKERALLPLIDDAQKRIVRAGTPTAALRLVTAAETDASLIRPCWDGLSIAARRSVITALIAKIELGPAIKRLSRHAPDELRLRLAAERTTITWIPRAAPTTGR